MSKEADHWQRVYTEKSEDDLSWHVSVPTVSADLICRFAPDHCARIIDVGGGTSRLVDNLLHRGYSNLTVLDIASAALEASAARLGESAGQVQFVCEDLILAQSLGEYDLWHDRALFHFLTDPTQTARYIELAARSVVPGGYVVIATFALDGPEACSGLTVCRYNSEALAEAFHPYFCLIEASRIEHITPWGKPQMFTVVVLRREFGKPIASDGLSALLV